MPGKRLRSTPPAPRPALIVEALRTKVSTLGRTYCSLVSARRCCGKLRRTWWSMAAHERGACTAISCRSALFPYFSFFLIFRFSFRFFYPLFCSCCACFRLNPYIRARARVHTCLVYTVIDPLSHMRALDTSRPPEGECLHDVPRPFVALAACFSYILLVANRRPPRLFRAPPAPRRFDYLRELIILVAPELSTGLWRAHNFRATFSNSSTARGHSHSVRSSVVLLLVCSYFACMVLTWDIVTAPQAPQGNELHY